MSPAAPILPSRRRPPEGAAGPLRLLHVFPNFTVGGAQVRLATLAAGFGPEVSHTILAISGAYGAAAIMPRDIPVDYLTPPEARSLPGRLRTYHDILTKVRPDVLLTYNWGAMEFAFANRLARRPHLHLEDGFGPEEAVTQFRRRVWARRLALRRSHVLVPSETLRRLALASWRIPPDRLHHVPNGLPHAGGSKTAEPLGLALDDERTRIIWSGALRPEKNPIRLLEAFAPLRDRAILVIIGEGPEQDRVGAAVGGLGLSSSVRLLGPRRDVRALLSQGDVLALSSDTEQMPLVVLEAMAAGLPVAAFDVGDVAQMVAPENRPFVVPADTAALTRALTRLVDDPPLRRKVGAANRARALAVYDPGPMVQAHRRLLETLAAGGPYGPSRPGARVSDARVAEARRAPTGAASPAPG